MPYDKNSAISKKKATADLAELFKNYLYLIAGKKEFDQFFQALKKILEQGADVNNAYVHPDIKETVLMYAAEYFPLPVVKLLVEYGADVNKKDDEGRTALMCAAYAGSLLDIRGNSAVVSFLIEHGADIEAEDNEGNTALFYGGCIKDVLDTLLKYNVNVHHKNHKGETALEIAQEYCNDEMAHYLEKMIKK